GRAPGAARGGRGVARRAIRRRGGDPLPLASEPAGCPLRGPRAAAPRRVTLKEWGAMSDAVNRTRYGDALRPPDGDVAPMTQIDFDLTATFDRVAEWQGSDLHLKHGSPPLVRVHGELVPLPDVRPLTPADT